MKLLIAKEVFLPDRVCHDSAVFIDGERILAVMPATEAAYYDCEKIDYGAAKILPGLIDTHIHGAMGYDVMDSTPEALAAIGRFLVQNGTTSYLATTVTADVPDICRAVANIGSFTRPLGTARLLGAFIEGPYLTEEHRGAHDLSLIRDLSRAEFEQILNSGPVSEILIAPEKPKAPELTRWAVHEAKIKIGLGHSSATYEQAAACFDAGADASIHTYCGMAQFHHRKPNLLGAALTRDDVFAELIADGIHVKNPAMQVLLRCKPHDKTILVSDAIRATGLADGHYMLGTLPFSVKDGVARIDNGSLAGSTTTLLAEVRRLITVLGIKPRLAVNMASLNPARRFALFDCGSIEKGKLADLVVVDEKFFHIATWLGGKAIK